MFHSWQIDLPAFNWLEAFHFSHFDVLLLLGLLEQSENASLQLKSLIGLCQG